MTRIERCLLPPPETVRWDHGQLSIERFTTAQKAIYCTKNFFLLAGYLLAAPVTLAADYFGQKQVAAVRKTADIVPRQIAWPPEHRGFACCLFQTSGLGTKWSAAPALVGKCDWDKWMDKPSHIIHPEGFDYKNFYTDVLSDPAAYIQMLKAHNATAHRFSLEWSVIEPRQGETDMKAVALYRNFIRKLLDANITPFITLSHFAVPEWFYELGNFQKLENIDHFVNFSLKAMELFPEVKNWWSFNEIGIKGFQQIREKYPTDLPEGSSLASRVHAMGVATRNMLIAHCKLHQEAAKLHPDKKVGVTHQWLKMDTASGNWLESLVSYLMKKLTFSPVYGFFKNGRYSFEFPFMANIHFEIPKEQFDANGRFLMRLGVQAYPMPMIKIGLNHGQTYPGFYIKNLPFFSFGGTCEPGGTVMRFGPRWRSEGMDEILDEAFILSDEIFLTEFGSDASVHKWGKPVFELDDTAQGRYLRELTERVRDYSARTFREIKGIFCWSDLRRQMEWENGHECRLGIVNPVVDKKRRMIGWIETFASQYLAKIYQPQAAPACAISA